MKKTLIAIIALVIIGVVVYFITKNPSDTETQMSDSDVTTNADVSTDTQKDMMDTSQQEDNGVTLLGKSSGGHAINAYRYGTGDKEVLFVGGIHGGYSWNTTLVAYELMDYLKENPTVIPENVHVTVVPLLNPDGLAKVLPNVDDRFTASDVASVAESQQIAGRFNGNNVDLNRNFDCDWQAQGVWQDKNVSGGASAFSEPETMALKNYVESHRPVAVVAWYSSAGGVFASNCHEGILPETRAIMNAYATASGYKAYDSFDFYAITGDMVNWLAKKSIPAISVLLTTHNDTEWTKNKAGIDALLKYYAK